MVTRCLRVTKLLLCNTVQLLKRRLRTGGVVKDYIDKVKYLLNRLLILAIYSK